MFVNRMIYNFVIFDDLNRMIIDGYEYVILVIDFCFENYSDFDLRNFIGKVKRLFEGFVDEFFFKRYDMYYIEIFDDDFIFKYGKDKIGNLLFGFFDMLDINYGFKG